MTMEGSLQVDGGRIWYKVVGSGGTPLIVLHGGPGATHDYLENLSALSDEHPVIFYDQLGGGRSDRPDDPSLWRVDRFVDELDALVQHLRLEHVHILGQSWGTMLAVLYAQSRGQDRIASMVLSAPYLNSDMWVLDQRRYVNALPDKVRKDILDCEISGDFSSPTYAEAMDIFYRRHVCRMPVWPTSLERSLQGMGLGVYNHMWGPSEFTLTGVLQGMNVVPFLKDIAVTTLYTCGEFDEATPATTKIYADHTPGSKMMVFEGASHMHHLEKENDFIGAVRSFLRDADRIN
ncbi:MAG: proline iminopeptidase-family hydrolase [Methanomassiliicoccales archaeon]|nr:proline iminopeptidase-family hydrolase [Methanomassiliicoccales archaeon]